jgi:hypothetical protein
VFISTLGIERFLFRFRFGFTFVQTVHLIDAAPAEHRGDPLGQFHARAHLAVQDSAEPGRSDTERARDHRQVQFREGR